MRLNPNAFNKFLGGIGQQVNWRESFVCSCVNLNTGSPSPTCQLCRKKGKIWSDPVQTVVGIASMKVQQKWEKLGQWQSGDMVLSVPGNSPVWGAGQGDRVTMLNSADRFSKVLVRGAVSESMALLDVVSIDRVWWKDPTTQGLVEGGIPVVATDGSLSWSSGEPPIGVSYSITGTAHSEYYVYDSLPSSRNEHSGVRLPKNIVLRRWDLYGR